MYQLIHFCIKVYLFSFYSKLKNAKDTAFYNQYLHQKKLCPRKVIGWNVKLLFWLGVIYQHTKINMFRKTSNFEKWLKTNFTFILIYIFLKEKKTFLISNYEMYIIQS